MNNNNNKKVFNTTNDYIRLFNDNTKNFMEFFNVYIKPLMPDFNKPIDNMPTVPAVFDKNNNKNFIVDNMNAVIFSTKLHKNKENIWNVVPNHIKPDSNFNVAVYFYLNKYVEDEHVCNENLQCVNAYTDEQLDIYKNSIHKYNFICKNNIIKNLETYFRSKNKIDEWKLENGKYDYNKMYIEYVNDMAEAINKYNSKEMANIIHYYTNFFSGEKDYKPIHDYKDVLKQRSGQKYSVEDIYKCISVARRLSNDGFLYIHENNVQRTLLTIEKTHSIYEKLSNSDTIKNDTVSVAKNNSTSLGY